MYNVFTFSFNVKENKGREKYFIEEKDGIVSGNFCIEIVYQRVFLSFQGKKR